MLSTLSIIFLQTLVLSLLLTPYSRRLAHIVGAVDAPNSRKVHKEPTPRLGGAAIYATILILMGMYYLFFPNLLGHIVSPTGEALLSPNQGLLIGGALSLVFFLGFWDDIKTLEAGPKFAVQFVAASMIYFAGVKIDVLQLTETAGIINLNLLTSYPLTIIWIIGITNGVNLIDGLDGLASGVAVIALSTIALISLVHGQMGIALTSIILSGAILGFLWYNFRPATIFLGDSGSLLLGFLLALLSIKSYTKTSTAFAIFVPLLALGLPIIDTLLSMVRRFFSWFLPANWNDKNSGDFTLSEALKSLFRPDKSHIHHQLINRGLSHKNTVLVLYIVSILFGIGALVMSLAQNSSTVVMVVMLLLVVIKLGIDQLRYKEIELFSNGIFLTFFNAVILNKRHFLKFLDAVFIITAFGASYYLLYPSLFDLLIERPYDTASISASMLVVHMASLWFFGVYRKTIRNLGIADITTIIKAVTIAIMAWALVHHLFFQDFLWYNFSTYVLNFYFLVTLIMGIRVSFHILKYLFYKSRRDNQRVLICGAGEQGMLALQRLMNVDKHRFTPVGFIDEDPEMQGRVINGFTVFGGHWKLEKLIRSKDIDELHISNPNLPSEVLRRIKTKAHQHDLNVRMMHTELRTITHNSPTKETDKESYEYAK